MHKATIEHARDSKLLINAIALLLLISCLIFAAGAQAQTVDSVGVLKFTRGNTTIQSLTGETRRAVIGDTLMRGDLVATAAASLAVIQLNDDSRITLRPNSEFRVVQLNQGGNGQQSAILSLLRGGLRLLTGLIGRQNPAAYRLNTPIATVGIRGTEFNTRLCSADCSAEESRLAGSQAAGNIDQGLYVNVDDGRVFLSNDAGGEPVDLDQGESGYVANANSLPVKLALVPAFLSLDLIPSPSQLNFDNIQIPDNVFGSATPDANVAGAPATAPSEAVSTEVQLSGTYAGFDVSGTYEIEVSYEPGFPRSQRRRLWGTSPDVEFTLTQEEDRMSGEFSGDMEGTIEGKVEGNKVTFTFVVEAGDGLMKPGKGHWIVEDDDTLSGDFEILDGQYGPVSGEWTLTRISSSGGSAFGLHTLFLFAVFSLIAYLRRKQRRPA